MSELASLPARSTSRKLPSGESRDSLLMTRMRQIACEREDWSFLLVDSVERSFLATSITPKNSFKVVGFFSRMPRSCIVPKESSKTLICFRSCRRSVQNEWSA